MNYVNIQRELIARLAVKTYAKRKNLPLRVTHINVLYLIYSIQGNNAGGGVHTTAVWSLMGRLCRGSDYPYLERLIKELQGMEFLAITISGKRKKLAITSAGRVVLNEIEKSLRITRFDRRKILNAKT